MDIVERGERAEASIDAFISKQDTARRKSEGERLTEELWMPSERAYFERQQEDNRAAWHDYEMRLYRIHAGLASEHLERAEKYRAENGHTGEENGGH